MEESPAAAITSYFSGLEDPRSDHTRWHQLIDIITITVCGVICGADSWVELEQFGKSKEEWLKRFLELPNGIPSHDDSPEKEHPESTKDHPPTDAIVHSPPHCDTSVNLF